MRNVAERRQQLEVEHKEALLVLQEKQEEVRRLQQVCKRVGEGTCYSLNPWEVMGVLHLVSLEVQCMEEVYMSVQVKVNQGRVSASRRALVPEQGEGLFL